MPALKRLLSSLSLRPQLKDDDVSQHPRNSILQRSNAVLKKKKGKERRHTFVGGIPPKEQSRQSEPENQWQEYRAEFLQDWRHSFQYFDDEMQAIANLRAERMRLSAVERQDDRAVGDAIWSRAAEAVRQRRSVQSLRDLHDRSRVQVIPGTLRYLDPLGTIHEDDFQESLQVAEDANQATSAAHSWLDSPQSSIDDLFTEARIASRPSASSAPSTDSAVPLHSHFNTSSVRREVWLHRKDFRESRRNSHHIERHRGSAGAMGASESSPVDSAFAVMEDEGQYSLQLKEKKRKSHDGRRSSQDVAGWLSAQDQLRIERSSMVSGIDEYLDALEQPQKRASKPSAASLQHEAVDKTGSLDQLAWSLAVSQLSDQQLTEFLQQRLPSPPKQRDCIVCGDSKVVPDFPAKAPTASCTHIAQTCTACLESWMTSEIDTKGTAGIRCPECPATLTHTDIHRAASPSAFATYDKLTIREALGALPDFSWCLSPTCPSGQENPHAANYMDCHACGYKQCLRHRIAWHADETCDEYDYRTSGRKARDEAEAERKTAAMLDSVSQKCPNPTGCGWRIQKVDGCDHMTCRRCRWEFCWLCGASQKEIRRVGNTAHGVRCKYHSRNLEVAWPFNAH